MLQASYLKRTQQKCQRTLESITHNSTRSISNLIWNKLTRRKIRDSPKLLSKVRRPLLVQMDLLKQRLLQQRRLKSPNLKRSCKRRRMRKLLRANYQTRTWSVLQGRTLTFKLPGLTQHLMRLWPKIQEIMRSKSCRGKKATTIDQLSAEAYFID